VKQFDIAFIGAANLDHIAVVPRIPGTDERVVSQGFITAGGGPAATAAVAAARQGVLATFVGVVGDDLAGDIVLAKLSEEQVDTSHIIVRASEKTAESLLLIEESTGLRTIITEEPPHPVLASTFSDLAPWLHVDHVGYHSIRQAAYAGALGARVSLDGGNPVDNLSLDYVELYAPTRSQILSRYPEMNLEEAMEAASQEGPRLVVVTAGSEGSWYREGGVMGHVPAFPVEAVSTLGAGDVFHGALISQIAQDVPLRDAVEYASATAALSCRGIDGRSAIPRSVEVQQFLAHHAPGVI